MLPRSLPANTKLLANNLEKNYPYSMGFKKLGGW